MLRVQASGSRSIDLRSRGAVGLGSGRGMRGGWLGSRGGNGGELGVGRPLALVLRYFVVEIDCSLLNALSRLLSKEDYCGCKRRRVSFLGTKRGVPSRECSFCDNYMFWAQ